MVNPDVKRRETKLLPSSFTLAYFLPNKIISNVQKSPMFMPAAQQSKLKRSKTVKDEEKKVYFSSSSRRLVLHTQGHHYKSPCFIGKMSPLRLGWAWDAMQTNITNTHMLFLQICDEWDLFQPDTYIIIQARMKPAESSNSRPFL